MQNAAIFGVPRSGTSWLGQILNSSPHVAYRYQPIFAYTFDSRLTENSTRDEIQKFHREVLETNDNFVCQDKNISGNRTPKFRKENITHLVWKEVRYLNIIENLIQQSATKVIGIVRHPCGVINSWMSTPREFDKNWDIKNEWRYAKKKNRGKYDFYGYEKWKSAAKMFLRLEQQYSDQFKLVVYESLIQNPQEITSSIFDFVDLKLTEQTYSFLKESTSTSSDDPYDVYRKNKDGYEWRDDLPSEIIEAILTDHDFTDLARIFKWKNLSN